MLNLNKLAKINIFGLSRSSKTGWQPSKYCHNPLIDGQYEVTAPRLVPDHIVRPGN